MGSRYKSGGKPAVMTTGPKLVEIINAVKGHPLFVCIFCKDYITDSEFDLDLHLYENHKPRLIKLPVSKRSLNYRIGYAINQGKKLGEVLKHTNSESRKKLGWLI